MSRSADKPSMPGIEALVVDDDDFHTLEQALGGFCPFEATGMVGQEIRHAHFLGYMLDPQRPHGLGTGGLRAFMAAAARSVPNDGSGLSRLGVHLMNFDRAEVRREWRSIDLLVIVPDARLVVAVELKIDAREHGTLLRRYRDLVHAEWPSDDGWRHLLLFLTKRGDAPSAEAAAHWVAVPLADVASELAGLAGEGASPAQDAVRAYVKMLRRHHLVDEPLEKLARQLWSRHAEVLKFLAVREPDATADVLAALGERVAQVADALSSAAGTRVTPDTSTGQYLRFAVPAWDEVAGMRSGTGWLPQSSRLLLFEIERDPRKGQLRCQFKLGPGDPDRRLAIFDALGGKDGDFGWKGGLSAKWRQLATKTLATVKDGDPDFDPEQVAGQVAEGARAFLKARFSQYDTAVRESVRAGQS